jgi:hypothetical protein
MKNVCVSISFYYVELGKMCPYVELVKMYVCLFLFTIYSHEIKLIKLLLVCLFLFTCNCCLL